MIKLIFVLFYFSFFLSCQTEKNNVIKIDKNDQTDINYKQNIEDINDNENSSGKENIEFVSSVIDPFSLNIFENIGNNVDFYKNKEGFIIINNTSSKEYREKEDPDNEVIVTNGKIIIRYKEYDKKIYREIEILNETETIVLGKYIGLSRLQIIGVFGEETTPWPGNSRYLQSVNRKNNFDLYINFYFNDENKIITKIVYGDFI